MGEEYPSITRHILLFSKTFQTNFYFQKLPLLSPDCRWGRPEHKQLSKVRGTEKKKKKNLYTTTLSYFMSLITETVFREEQITNRGPDPKTCPHDHL